MRLKRVHALIVLALTVAAVAVAAGFAAPNASSGTTQNCWPDAQVPYVWQFDRTGAAHTFIENCNVGYVANVYLKNRAGNTLRHDAWWVPSNSGGVHLIGTVVSCAGAYVHTDLWMDIGISDTSGETAACTY